MAWVCWKASYKKPSWHRGGKWGLFSFCLVGRNFGRAALGEGFGHEEQYSQVESVFQSDGKTQG